uniref:Uncharacterized protein n=1 Tax=Lepeophtheirus salmonis TaxID=72036 RepID=A0A0K2UV63_LEPSM
MSWLSRLSKIWIMVLYDTSSLEVLISEPLDTDPQHPVSHTEKRRIILIKRSLSTTNSTSDRG